MFTLTRTHNCNGLRIEDKEKEVCLNGWIQSRRDHGGIIFIDLRDRYGLTQVVFDPSFDKKCHVEAEHLRREDVLAVKGIVKPRRDGMTNPNLNTGEIEVYINKLEILSKADTPPIEIEDRTVATDETRLKYRYLDLRRPTMQKNFLIRHKAAQAAREKLNELGFLEIETPLLMKATPEGARDYIVPSRVNIGSFYALPQSPQLYKQLLMVGGFDRYYQIARCLRDEDLRADRQPEFTQIDVELSFPTQDMIFDVAEKLVKNIMKKTIDKDIKTPFKRITYKEAMDKYGCDKPDMRFNLELTDVTDIVKDSNFQVFKAIASTGGVIKCINPETEIARNEIDRYIAFCQEHGAKGMAWMRVTETGLESNIVKFFSDDIQKKIIEKAKAKPGSTLMFIADKKKQANDVLARLRNKLGEDLNLYKKEEFNFTWVVDFPLFEFDEELNDWVPAHHMFTMPKAETLEFIETAPEKVIAQCYDLTLNGVELSSGSIRIHRNDIQERVMNRVGFSKEEAETKFGFLLESFKYGAPPHGGFAIGFDRLVAMILGYSDIREVIAFPKNKSAVCPMDGSPSAVDEKALKELHIKLDIVKKK